MLLHAVQPQLVRGAHWRLEVLPQCVPLPILLLNPADLPPLNEGDFEDLEQSRIKGFYGQRTQITSAAHRLKIVLSEM